MELRSARLVLRDFTADDVARLFEYQSYPLYLRHSEGDAPGLDDVRRLVERFRGWATESPRMSYQLAITLDGHLIGTCGVRRDQDAAAAEFGCELDPDFWGHGYAREASAAILAFARDALRVERIVARTRPDNRAAVRLAEDLGLRMVGDGVFALDHHAAIPSL